jgi:hypothetical protein
MEGTSGLAVISLQKVDSLLVLSSIRETKKVSVIWQPRDLKSVFFEWNGRKAYL